MVPPKLDAAQAASAAQFDRQSNRYGRSHILADTADLDAAMAHITAESGTALDVATGGGHAALFLARRGWQVTAGDIAPRMLENAARLAAEEGFTIATRLFPAEEIPFSAASFDLVSVRVAPHHFSSPAKFVAEVARVLRPGGSFLLIDGTVPDDDPASEAWLHAVEKLRDPSHGRFLSRQAWEKLVRDAGLSLRHSALHRKKQPDLEWYFEAAATPADNRAQVRYLVQEAPADVRAALSLGEEGGKTAWWWPMLTLVARAAG